MAHQVVFAPQAEADVEAIVDYIARDNPEAAHHFGRELLAQARALAQNPYLGIAMQRRPGVRYLVHYPYLIFYCVNEEDQTVEVLRFWHSARDQRKLRLSR